jgi:bifunctional non-homologous end joining protein LigD
VARSPRLKEYEKKRRFDVTPEPAPGQGKRPETGPKGAAIFMVHKHAARALHYDLRLEMDGALASWAIPKGPSYDPAIKRLAVQTEDHPLEYGSFEGRIPEGEYGAGDSLIWDRGWYETIPPGEQSAMRQKGHLALTLHGEKLKGQWHLVRTGSRKSPAGPKSQWLFFKGKDELANSSYDVVSERPESVESGRKIARGPEPRRDPKELPFVAPEDLARRVFPPMLTTLVKELPKPREDWEYELKYDGFRAVAGVATGGRVALLSRNDLDLKPRFPAVVRALQRLVVREAVLDGEVVALDPRGVPRFQLLQDGTGPLVYFVFDLLWLDGEDLRERPLEERRELLQSLVSNAPPEIQLSLRIDDPESFLKVAARKGFEGVVAKRRGTPYRGSRSRDWLKIKVLNEQEMAIVGFTDSTAGGGMIGALLLAVSEGKTLRFAGKVGTGFSEKLRVSLRKQLTRDEVAQPTATGAPRMKEAHWVKPKLVAQVAFSEWTSDDLLRQPSFLGLRDDKGPYDTKRERVK